MFRSSLVLYFILLVCSLVYILLTIWGVWPSDIKLSLRPYVTWVHQSDPLLSPGWCHNKKRSRMGAELIWLHTYFKPLLFVTSDINPDFCKTKVKSKSFTRQTHLFTYFCCLWNDNKLAANWLEWPCLSFGKITMALTNLEWQSGDVYIMRSANFNVSILTKHCYVTSWS